MKRSSFSQKRIIHAFIVMFILIMIILIAVLLMFKYTVEGEKNLPFKIAKINIVSTAESNLIEEKKDEEEWRSKMLQKNDIFFVIEKNNNYKKEEAIKKISFENFQIMKKNEKMEVSIYRPTTSINTYNYSDEYKIQNSLEYSGGQNTNTETLQINNQGGTIGFSITSDNIGEYVFPKNEKLDVDGKLLAKAGVKKEDIDFSISFDLIIETVSNYKFKTNIVLELPAGNILEEGIGTLEDTELTNVVFKRI